MAALTFGTARRSEWDTLSTQLIYSVVNYRLLANRSYNHYSLDAILRKR